jgi:hypothetical protein
LGDVRSLSEFNDRPTEPAVWRTCLSQKSNFPKKTSRPERRGCRGVYGQQTSVQQDDAAFNHINGGACEGDAHYGRFVRHRYLARRDPNALNLRQVHLIPSELFDPLRKFGFDVRAGDLGENITTIGLDLECLPLGTVLRLGASAILELTGLRTPCVLIDRFKAGLKDRLQGGAPGPRFRAGVMAVVSEGGEVALGDCVRAFLPAPPHLDLPPL